MVTLLRLYALRAVYLLIAVGQGAIQLPLLIHHGPWSMMSGVAHALLAALALLSLLGLRYPLRMLPLLLFELLWKTIWLGAVALPLWLAHQVDADTADTIWACLPVIIVPIVLPWSYLVANYVTKPGDRWR
jgi:hypothetical protein